MIKLQNDSRDSNKMLPKETKSLSDLIDYFCTNIPHRFDAMICGYSSWSKYSKIYHNQIDIVTNTKEAMRQFIDYLQTIQNTKKIKQGFFSIYIKPITIYFNIVLITEIESNNYFFNQSYLYSDKFGPNLFSKPKKDNKIIKKLKNGSMIVSTRHRDNFPESSIIDIDQCIKDLINGTLTVCESTVCDFMESDDWGQQFKLLENSYNAMVHGYKIECNGRIQPLFDSLITYCSNDVHKILDTNLCNDVIQIITGYLEDCIYDSLCTYCCREFDPKIDRLPYIGPRTPGGIKYFGRYESWLNETMIDCRKVVLHIDCLQNIIEDYECQDAFNHDSDPDWFR